MMSHDEFKLSEGDLSIGLVPDIGGSLSFFRWRDVDLMRPFAGQARARRDVLGVAMFPMLPYANRVADNRFAFAGREWRVQANNPPERFNVHGTGWRRAWQVAETSPSSALLTLEVKAASDPYSYRAEQHFALADGILRVSLMLRNTGEHPFPFGFGLHPWFERKDGVTLRFSARRFYLEEPEGVAGDPVTLPPELDFAQGRTLPSGWRNNDYGRWDGTAEIRFRDKHAGLRLSADPLFKHLMLYADPAKPYFCLEPQTNASGALSRGHWGDPDENMVILASGEAMRGTACFAPFEL